MNFKIAEYLSIRKIDNEVFILNRKDSRLHAFNETGAYLWGIMQSKNSSEELIEALFNKYEVNRATAKSDVMDFLNEMQELKLLDRL